MNYKNEKMMHISITVINMMIIAEQVLTELSSTTEQSGEKPVQWVLSNLFNDMLPRSAVVLSNLVKSQYIGYRYSAIYLTTYCLAVQ